MTRPHLLVTYDPGSDVRRLLTEYLAEVSELGFVKDLDAARREEALADAEILLSWNPPKEIADQEYRLFQNLRFVQLVAAGANHVPYALIPDQVVIASNVGRLPTRWRSMSWPWCSLWASSFSSSMPI